MRSYCDWWIGFKGGLSTGPDQDMKRFKRFIRHLAAQREVFGPGPGTNASRLTITERRRSRR